MLGYSIAPHYLDASALVKLVADDIDEEPGREALRKYYWAHTASVYSTSYCVTETFSAFKSKFLRKKITEDQYISYIREFRRLILGVNLRIDDVEILAPFVFTEAERMIKAHGIDFLDCFQIVTLLQGQFRVFASNSKSILITADKNLAKAARAEGARVWYCVNEEPPDNSYEL